MLLAAAHQTGLLASLDTALLEGIQVSLKEGSHRLSHTRASTRQRLLATLLFLPVASLARPWELRSYTGKLLALLSNRAARAYSYPHTERFLAQVAKLNCDRPLSQTLARWTTQLWHGEYLTNPTLAGTTSPLDTQPAVAKLFYVDGHHKPVYSDKLLPRGMVGKFGKILGCRGLTLLHDEKGHPLLVTTSRGDTHLTVGLPEIVTQYEQALASALDPTLHPTTIQPPAGPWVKEIVADREIMAANFLATQLQQGRAFITLLDVNQYQGLSCFEEVGEFIPLEYDRQGGLMREVAPAKFTLSLPHSNGKTLKVKVALIRDQRHQVSAPLTAPPKPPNPQLPPNPAQGLATKPGSGGWWESGWEAAPTPLAPSQAKLIPIVTTGPRVDPVALVELYRRRWPCQENIFKDWLLPLGVDTNHGFATHPVPNSTTLRKGAKLEQHLNRLQERTTKTRVRMQRAAELSDKYFKQHVVCFRQLEQVSVECQFELEAQGLTLYELKAQMEERLAPLRKKCKRLKELHNHHYTLNYDEHQKLAGQCAKQSRLLRQIEDLKSRQRSMVELDNRKDQIMSVLKVALANLGMWVRDHYFPASYANSTWTTLLPFFKLGGWVSSTKETLEVELESFNDQRLNRELALICENLAAAPLQLPTGQYLKLQLKEKVSARPVVAAKTSELPLAG